MTRRVIIALLFFCLGCSKDDPITSCPVCTNPLLDSSASVVVRRVLDGDTFKFSIGSDTIDVRLLGVDAFETKHGSHLDEQASAMGIDTATAIQIGFKARAFSDSLLTNRTIIIYRDPSQPYADPFGRLLRHVFFTEGHSNIDFGLLMIDKGFAIKD